MKNKETNSGELLIIKNNSEKELSKIQKQFNTRVKKIADLKSEIETVKKLLEVASVKIHNDIVPLELKMLEKKKELIYLLDKSYSLSYFKKQEKEKMKTLILELCEMFIGQFNKTELIEMYDKYADESYEDYQKSLHMDTFEMAKSLFGLDLEEEEVDFKNPDNIQDFIQEKMQQKMMEEEERRQKKKKTAKQIEKEEKKKKEISDVNKASRTIYTELVKFFHPDREKDEKEKEKKTSIMHKITEAYEKNDLFSLLKLQLEYMPIKEEGLEILTEQQLGYYNKLLQEQINELQNEIFELKGGGMSNFGSGMNIYHQFCDKDEKKMEMKFKTHANQIKKVIKTAEKDAAMMSDKTTLRIFLQNIHLEEFDDDFDIPFPFKF